MKERKSILDLLYFYMILEDYMYKQKFIQLMEIPKIEKIIIHSSSSKMTFDKKFLSTAALAIELISLQKPFSVLSKKPIAAFNLRKNQTIAETVTLSKSKTFFNFLDKLIFLIYPNFREFNGLAPVDSYGTCNNSFTNFFFFPETKSFYQHFDFLSGFNISIKLTNYYLQEKSVNLAHKVLKKTAAKFDVFLSFFPLPSKNQLENYSTFKNKVSS